MNKLLGTEFISKGAYPAILKGGGGSMQVREVTIQPLGSSDVENACRRRMCLYSMKHGRSTTQQHFGQTCLTKRGGG